MSEFFRNIITIVQYYAPLFLVLLIFDVLVEYLFSQEKLRRFIVPLMLVGILGNTYSISTTGFNNGVKYWDPSPLLILRLVLVLMVYIIISVLIKYVFRKITGLLMKSRDND